MTDDDSALEVQVRAKRVSKLAAAGHEAAVATYGALARYLAEGVANLANVLDPEAVILSGGVVEEKVGFTAEVQAHVQQCCTSESSDRRLCSWRERVMRLESGSCCCRVR